MIRLFGRGGILHPTLNIAKYRDLIPEITKGKVVLNIGSGNHRLAPHITNLDLFEGVGIDVVSDAHSLPFPSQSVDAVLLLAVLEHVIEPGKVISETFRVLKNGGLVYCEFPFLQPEHNAPADYWRVTLSGLRYLFRDFKELDAGVCCGAGSAMSWLSVEYARCFSLALPLIARILLLPLKYADRPMAKRGKGLNIASCYYYYGEKP